MDKLSIFWFRRDLRLTDNHGLFKALSENKKVLLLFIFDSSILSILPENDARVSYIYEQIKNLNISLKKYGSSILIKHGIPSVIFKELCSEYIIENVYCNHDYEPSAIKRDDENKKLERIALMIN